MPWDMERLTHNELRALEEKHRIEEAEARAQKRRL